VRTQPDETNDLLPRLTSVLEDLLERHHALHERLDRIERAQSRSVVKEAYTTEEASEHLGRTSWTVRQWCNKGQVRAVKVHGKGRQGEWRIPHDELARIQAEGPSPVGFFRTA
jgi:excisionase family DNA binding protein